MTSSTSLTSKPFIVAKAIDLWNKKAITMSIVDLFSEIRMATHYVEMLKRKQTQFIVNCSSISIENELPIEPFGIGERPLNITEFLNNYPFFEELRKDKKYDHLIHCLSSTVTHIIEDVLRPLPFQPTHIINDSYNDFLMYSTQISRFINNRLIYQHKYPDNLLHSSLNFPLQLDFWIIPQSVSESKIQHSDKIITDYDKQCDQLLLGIGNTFVKDIGKQLQQFNIKFIQVTLDREPAQFYQRVTREFDAFQNNERHRRYIFIIDRRNPNYDGKYFINNNDKTWHDRLYIYSPPKYNQLSPRCDMMPEGFINRTMEYILPLKKGRSSDDEKVIGANCVANGYLFALSYHLYQDDKVKAYFHSNGAGQRFTKDEIKYYWPRLFMKINGEFQDELKQNENLYKEFKDISINDRQHKQFRQTMKINKTKV